MLDANGHFTPRTMVDWTPRRGDLDGTSRWLGPTGPALAADALAPGMLRRSEHGHAMDTSWTRASTHATGGDVEARRWVRPRAPMGCGRAFAGRSLAG